MVPSVLTRNESQFPPDFDSILTTFNGVKALEGISIYSKIEVKEAELAAY